MTVKPHVAVRKRSVCDLVRLAVRPVNSDFDIFIRILPYLNNKWREDARKLSWPRHGHVYTKTSGSSEAWTIFFSLFFWAVRAQTTVTRRTLRASFEVNLYPILKTNTLLQRPCNSLNEHGLFAGIQREMTPWRSLEISRCFAAHGTPRETTVTRPTLRALFEVNLCPILKRNTPLQRPCN